MTDRLRETTDLLSPILVKEFRQGVRGHAFTGAFLLLHALMVLAIALSLVEPNAMQAAGVFWWLMVLPVGFLVPLSGMQALSYESALRTLEPMLLTRLSPRSIVLGKWLSLSAQNLLLVVSIMPYFLLRYFLGGIDFVQESWAAADLVVTSAVLTAIAVGASSFSMPAVFRWLAGLPLMNVVAVLIQPFFIGPAAAALSPKVSALAFGLAALTIFVLIEAGAWQIAPAADRSSTAARIVTLAWLPLIAWATSPPGVLREQAAMWTGVVLVLVVVGSLCEPQSAVRSVYARHFGRGPAARLAGWVLAPGWAAGTLFAVVATVGACLALGSVFAELGRPVVMTAILGQLLLPLAAPPHVWLRQSRPLAWYLIVQGASFAVGAVSPFAANIEAPLIESATAWLVPLSPVLGLLLAVEGGRAPSTALDVLSLAFAAAVIGLALMQALTTLRRTERRMREPAPERRAPAESDEPGDDAAAPRVANL